MKLDIRFFFAFFSLSLPLVCIIFLFHGNRSTMEGCKKGFANYNEKIQYAIMYINRTEIEFNM